MPKNNRGRVISALARAKDKVTDKVGGAIAKYSYSGFKTAVQSSKADREYKMYKMVNDSKGKPDAGNESDPLFRGRTMMKHAQAQALKNAQK